MTRLPTGIPALDDALDQFRIGDNIILENEVSAPPDQVLGRIIRAAKARGAAVHFLTFDASPRAVKDRIPGLEARDILDCFSFGQGRGAPGPGDWQTVRQPDVPEEVLAAMEQCSADDPTALFVVDSLNGMARLWGSDETAVAFYATACPQLYDAGNLAVWVLHAGVQSPGFHAAIGHIAQVVLDLRRHEGAPVLLVQRASNRPDAVGKTVRLPP